MRHVLFTESASYTTAVLVKTNALRKAEMERHYIKPLEERGVDVSGMIGFNLKYEGKKAPVKLINDHLANLMKAMDSLGIHTLYVCDTPYFKKLTGAKKAEPHHGYVLPCKIKGYEHMNVVLGVNYQGLFYNPELQAKMDLGLNALASHLGGTYKALGEDIIHSAAYPWKTQDIAAWFEKLHQYPMLTCDIEAFSLRFYEAGIGTIGFAWDEHNGVAFPCDYQEKMGAIFKGEQTIELHGVQRNNKQVKQLFRDFLESYEGTLVWHNAGYDAKVIIYELWMDHPMDQAGLLKGLEVMTKRVHDTQIITYLATNSTAGNKLSLKDQAHEFAGNYAQAEINDIRRIPLDKLLEYNLVDCLSTFYVYNKHMPTVVADNQESIYNEIMLPSLKLLLQAELSGMPLNMDQVRETDRELSAIRDGFMKTIQASPVIEHFMKYRRLQMLLADFEARKAKAVHPDKIKRKPDDAFDHEVFNPNSTPQLQVLFYEFLDFPIIDVTDTKQPATGGKTLAKLIHHSKDAEHTALLEALIGFFEVDKILGTFIKAFYEKSVQIDGWYYLFGSFKLGGTVSGRLSSNGPNLQNMPSSGSKYAKHIKKCFQAPDGWLLVGADFASLEDRISALTTKDPMKLKVYTDGYDGHCLRAWGYFGDRMPDIVETVQSINSIKTKYPDIRQESKTPTFLLTYGGTYHGLMGSLGLPEVEAKMIEANYHKMYVASDEWVAEKIAQASRCGYVEVAFGLRVRTPILAQALMNNKKTPYEAQAEARTAGNALGQSYGMLNNRAGIEFQQRTLASEYRMDIRPIAHIHDAQYFMIRNDMNVVKWVNDNLIPCMEWQELPEIYHPEVKLGGDLEIFYPSWATSYELPNGASKQQIRDACQEKEAA